MTASAHPHLLKRWTSCPVALHAIAIASDESHRDVIDWINPRSPFRSEVTLRRPVDDRLALWGGIVDARLRMGIEGDLCCEIVFTNPDVRFEVGSVRFTHVLPATLASAFAHAPVRNMVDHPLFTGIAFGVPEDYDEHSSLPIAPAQVPVADARAFSPGMDYVALAKTKLAALKG